MITASDGPDRERILPMKISFAMSCMLLFRTRIKGNDSHQYENTKKEQAGNSGALKRALRPFWASHKNSLS